MPDDLAEAIKTLVAEYEKGSHAFAETLHGYERDSFSLAAAEGYWESGNYRGRQETDFHSQFTIHNSQFTILFCLPDVHIATATQSERIKRP